MKVLSLFSGIAGIELGFQNVDWETVMFCENNLFAQTVLKTHFPFVPLINDIREINKHNIPEHNLITAGFPCQDLSTAGKGDGLNGKNSGLVEKVFEIIEFFKTPFVLLENVKGLLSNKKGKSIAHIINRFESLNYNWAYRVLDARSFGIPQRRKRVFILAIKKGIDIFPWNVIFRGNIETRKERRDWPNDLPISFSWTEGKTGIGWCVDGIGPFRVGSGLSIPSPPAIILSNKDIGTPNIKDAERLQGFPENWTECVENLKNGSRERWKLIGNSVVPNMTRWIADGFNTTQNFKFDKKFINNDSKQKLYSACNIESKYDFVEIGDFPENCNCSLKNFLKYQLQTLSNRALSGFLKRAKSGNLKFPDGFLNFIESQIKEKL